jgi:hypothetical protein
MLDFTNELKQEHDAWLDMCKELQTKLKVNRAEFNSGEYKKLIILIERWAYYDRERRQALKNYGDERQKEYAEEIKGIFYTGEDMNILKVQK